MLAVYAYFDAQRTLKKAESDEFNFLGTWASTGTYLTVVKDTVNYSNSQFVCIVDNVGYNPQLPDTRENPQKWSPLVLLVPGSAGTDSLAQAAYDLAVIGTNIGTAAFTLATAGSNLAWEAFVLAESGTSGSDPQTLAIAQAAFSIAVVGTNRANDAYALASIGTNVGTNAFNLATAGSNLAWQAFVLAQNGTGAAGAMAVAQSAFSIAVAGTTVGTNALNVAQQAFTIAVAGTSIGTLANNTATQALATANEALAIAVIGTTAINTTVNLLSAGTTFGTNVAIGNGTNLVFVNGLNLPFVPQCVVCTMQMPDINSLNLWPTLVGQPTANGFVVSLNGNTDSSDYRMHFLFRR